MNGFEEVYRRYFRDVYLYACALTKDTHLAEDITADTFLKALSGLRTFRGDCDLRVWLCQIAKNTYLSHCRKQKKLAALPEENLASEGQMEEQVADRDLAEQIDRYVQAMQEPYRRVFVLRTYYALPYGEIAAVLGRTESWARVTYSRAKAMIQRHMKEEEYE